jgi:hypothetical protein
MRSIIYNYIRKTYVKVTINLIYKLITKVNRVTSRRRKKMTVINCQRKAIIKHNQNQKKDGFMKKKSHP